MADGTRFTLRLLDLQDDLSWAASYEGQSRSEFVRAAVREKVEEVREDTTTDEGEADARL